MLVVEDTAGARHRIRREDCVSGEIRRGVGRHIVAGVWGINSFRLHDVTSVRISRWRDGFWIIVTMISGRWSRLLRRRRRGLFRCRRLRHDVIGMLRHRRGGQTDG